MTDKCREEEYLSVVEVFKEYEKVCDETGRNKFAYVARQEYRHSGNIHPEVLKELNLEKVVLYRRKK